MAKYLDIDVKEASKWNEKTIEGKILNLRKQLSTLKLEKSVSGIKTPHILKNIRRDIARLITLKNRNGKGK